MIELTQDQTRMAEHAEAFLRGIAEALSTKEMRVEVRLTAEHKADYSKPSSDWYSIKTEWLVNKEYETSYAQSDANLQRAIHKMDTLTDEQRAKIRLERAKDEVKACVREVRRLSR